MMTFDGLVIFINTVVSKVCPDAKELMLRCVNKQDPDAPEVYYIKKDSDGSNYVATKCPACGYITYDKYEKFSDAMERHYCQECGQRFE